MTEYNFSSQDLKNSYEEVRIVMNAPLYDVDAVNNDFNQVEDFLRELKVTYFGVNLSNNLMIFWTGDHLTRYDPKHNPPSILTITDKAIFHKYLPKVLQEAKKTYEEYLKK